MRGMVEERVRASHTLGLCFCFVMGVMLCITPKSLGAPVTDKIPVLVLLASFTDQFPVGTNADYWHQVFFGPGRSVRDYFREVSYGQLDLVPAAETHGHPNDGVIGWIQLPYKHPNPGDEINIGNEDIVRDAIFFADPYVDFQSFDKNGNGALSRRELLVFVIVAGYEAAYATVASSKTCSPSVIAHVDSFQSNPDSGGGDDGEGGVIDTQDAPIMDGVRIGSGDHGGAYIQSGEWHCADSDAPGHPATIGILAQQVGRFLGAPDLSDIDGSSAGVGKWDLMGEGAWNGIAKPGDRPAHPSAWTKSLLGWITPQQVKTPTPGARLTQVETSKDGVYQLLDNLGEVDWSPGSTPGKGEYFLVENREKVGYDEALPGAGILVWHVDESQADNEDEHHKLLDLVEASKKQDLDCICNNNFGDDADPFPGSENVRSLDDQTAPSTRLYNNLPSQVAFNNISDSGSVMTADFLVSQSKPGGPRPIFDESFESGNGDWQTSGIVQVTSSSLCGGGTRPESQVWYFGDPTVCSYSNSAQIISDERPLPAGATRLTIQFAHYLDINRLDRVELGVSFNGGKNWRRVWTGRPVQGPKKDWKNVTMNLAVPRNGASVELKFTLFKVPRSTGGRGWLFDNLKVMSAGSPSAKSAALSERTISLGTTFTSGSVELEIFNLRGQLIYAAQADGSDTISWHLEDSKGKPVPSGVYLYVLRARDRAGQIIDTHMQKLAVVR